MSVGFPQDTSTRKSELPDTTQPSSSLRDSALLRGYLSVVAARLIAGKSRGYADSPRGEDVTCPDFCVAQRHESTHDACEIVRL